MTAMTGRRLILSLWLLLLLGCVTGPDGRRTLGPGARAFGEAMLEQVLTCSVQAGLGAAVSAATSSGPPTEEVLLKASSCHIELAAEQAKRALRAKQSAKKNSVTEGEQAEQEIAEQATVEHGRKILEARTLEDAGLHDAAIDAARACDAMARKASGR